MNRLGKWISFFLFAGTMLLTPLAQAAPPATTTSTARPTSGTTSLTRAPFTTQMSWMQTGLPKLYAKSFAAGDRWTAKIHDAMGQYCSIRALQSGSSAFFALTPYYGLGAAYHQQMAKMYRSIADQLDPPQAP